MPARPRLVLTHDPELDDVNTLIRALLYSCDFQLEGLVYASSEIHFRGDGRGTTQYVPGSEYARLGHGPVTAWRWPAHDAFIDDVVDAYAQAWGNLRQHDAHYPTPAEVRSKVRWGNVDFAGDYSHDTPGSDLIKRLLLDARPGPLYVTAGGGQSTIARALKSIHDDFVGTAQWPAIRDKVSRKLIIIPFGDQDGTNARYIRPDWPGVATWHLDMIDFGYGAAASHGGANEALLGAAWTNENVTRRGPLGALYRVWGDGRQMAPGDVTDYFGLAGLSSAQLRALGYFVWTPPREPGAFISEGDTPTFLDFIDNGLRAWQDPSWGGWGGRVDPAARPPAGPDGATAGESDPGIAAGLVRHAAGVVDAQPPAAGAAASAELPAWPTPVVPEQTRQVNERFFAAAQRDFAARLAWSVTPDRTRANHAPVVSVRGSLALRARPGERVTLHGSARDPDGDRVALQWWQYRDAGTYPGAIAIEGDESPDASFTVPEDARPGQVLHVILEATDGGTPALTRYQRVVISVR